MPQSTEQRTHILSQLDKIKQRLPEEQRNDERAAYLVAHFFNKTIDQLHKILPHETDLTHSDRRFLWAVAVQIEEAFNITGSHVFSQIVMEAARNSED